MKRSGVKRAVRIILIVAGAALVLLFILGFLLAGYSMRIKRQSLDEARAWQEAHYNLSWYDGAEKKDYTVLAPDGYELHAQFIKNPKETDKYIIISHGYTDNRYGALKYAKIYLNLGFNLIVYDLRGHGANEKTFCTYTIRESLDLNALISDTRQRYPDMKTLGIHGESLGAATSVAVLKYRPPIDFVVADCGFSEIMGVMQVGLKAMHLPAWLAHVASVCAQLRYGCDYAQMRPIDSLAGNTVPILFIHGADDAFIVPEHSKKMARATSGYSEVLLIPGAGHAASVLTDPELYKTHVRAFLEKIGMVIGES